MSNYWLCVTNEENWKVIKTRRIWGVTERNRKQLETVKTGDLLVFYVKPKRIAGIFTSVTNMFENRERIFNSSGFSTDEAFPLRLKLKPLIISKEPIDFTSLISKLAFVKRKDKMWRGSIYGKAMRQIPRDDYKVIEAELRRA